MTRKLWFDITNSLQVRILILSKEVSKMPLLSLNEPGEKWLATIILGVFVNNP